MEDHTYSLMQPKTMTLKRKISHKVTGQKKGKGADEPAILCRFCSEKKTFSGLKRLQEEVGGSPFNKKNKLDHNELTLTREEASSSSTEIRISIDPYRSYYMRWKYGAKEDALNKKQQATTVEERRAAFHAKYEEQSLLGQGDYALVFKGQRRADLLPVAIKRIQDEYIYDRYIDEDGNIAMELAIMLKLAGELRGSAGGTSAPVALLDYYDLKEELILVLERPEPCMDLMKYVEIHGGSLQQQHAKVIIKQLLAAAMQLDRHSIFHRDLKLDNILIQTCGDTIRVRIIDFGMSCILRPNVVYTTFIGANVHKPPEVKSHRLYTAGPATVWQIGAVLYELVHRNMYFYTPDFLSGKLQIRKRLSEDCQDFLRRCLAVAPVHRFTLLQLQHHPWLQ